MLKYTMIGLDLPDEHMSAIFFESDFLQLQLLYEGGVPWFLNVSYGVQRLKKKFFFSECSIAYYRPLLSKLSAYHSLINSINISDYDKGS